jgi:glucose-6-phosphate dehydrogenase assembly protein OpcA
MAEHLSWSAERTSPSAIADAMRELLRHCHGGAAPCIPARALNLVCVADADRAPGLVERLRRVGRHHASRTVALAVEPGRTVLAAAATIAAEVEPRPGEHALLHETVTIAVGERHVPHLDTIVDPLVVPDLPTVLWSPGDHPDAVRSLLRLAQAVLVDSAHDADLEAGLRRAVEARRRAYVVDLAWLRSTPWRERVAACFDPPGQRDELAAISALTVRHEPGSAAAALLLAGWMASRLQWRLAPLAPVGDALAGHARAGAREVRIALEPAAQQVVPGLAGLTVSTAGAHELSLERGPGGLRARERIPGRPERRWTVLGASRGEGGILGEGIRQALLRDATYGPALTAACSLTRRRPG